MTGTRRRRRRLGGGTRRPALRRLLSALLLVGFVAAHGAAIAHAHPDGVHDAACTLCRVADDAGHALLSVAPAPLVLETRCVVQECTAPERERVAQRRAHPPRAPPFV